MRDGKNLKSPATSQHLIIAHFIVQQQKYLPHIRMYLSIVIKSETSRIETQQCSFRSVISSMYFIEFSRLYRGFNTQIDFVLITFSM